MPKLSYRYQLERLAEPDSELADDLDHRLGVVALLERWLPDAQQEVRSIFDRLARRRVDEHHGS